MLKKLEKINKGMNKLSEIIIRLVGLCAFTAQTIQGFIGLWQMHVMVEVFLLIIYFVIVRYPNKILYLFDAFISRIRKVTTKNRNMSNLQDDPEEVTETTTEQNNVGGEGTDETNL